MSGPISVILVDDHPMVLQGVAACIEDSDGIDLIAKASDVAELLTLEALVRCDVLILDINLPEINGIKAVQMALKKNDTMKVLMFSMHRGMEYARQALAAGASGYVFKDAMPEDLITAIQTVHRGGTYLPPETAAALATGKIAVPNPAGTGTLTAREREVLTRVAAGHSSKSIAWEMGLSVRTVEAHRRSIKQKLGAKSASECVSIALNHGLIS